MEKPKRVKNHFLATLRYCCILVLVSAWTGVAYTQTATDISTRTVTLGFQQQPLESALLALEQASGFQFTFPQEPVEAVGSITFPEAERTVEATLRLLLEGSNLDFQVLGNNIVLSVQRETPPAVTAPPAPTVSTQTRTITGIVTNEFREPLPFVTVSIPGTTTGAVADMNGRFSITVPGGTRELQASFIGFRTATVALTAATNYTIVLESEAVTLDQVVIVGTVERNVESFTGSFNVVSGNELRQMGSMNLVESLRSLDPGFIVMENMALGANPNAMPTIEVRGQTSIVDFGDVDEMFRTDPNQPLFILDGFETTLQRIVDLDPNRIESVTLLKDAASTAFFGARAANGVVVVTTIQGEPGRFQVFYTGDFSLEIPNLRSYNMMNAAEKLEFERLSGRYTFDGPMLTWIQAEVQDRLDALYNARLADIARGVNTDWMAMPLQVPFQQRHSLRFSGGTDVVMFNAGVTYRNRTGVMRGSGRETWAANLDLTYNHGNLSFVNRLDLSGFIATESPWGDFSDWVNANPYFRPVDENGDAPRFLDRVMSNAGFGTVLFNMINPYFVATQLNSQNEQRNTTIDNRFGIIWSFHQNMRLEGSFQVNWANTNRIIFSPPEHPQYDDVEDARRGNYRNITSRNMNYRGHLRYTFSNRIGRNFIMFNANAEIASNERTGLTWGAQGFPPGTSGRPSFAHTFTEGRPGFTNNVSRSVGLMTSVNYAWNERYLFDATFRYDGTSIFGTARRFTPFWSTGIGWNIHNEDFMRQFRRINRLGITATIGETGNQNLAAANSSSLYNFQLGGNVFGPGVIIGTIGNPNIEWQRTRKMNLALRLDMFDRRFTSTFEIFENQTNPLMVPVMNPPSTGVMSFPMSLGTLTYRGFEFDVAYMIIRQRNFSWRLRVMGTSLRGVYSNFDGRIEELGEQAGGAFARIRDGFSPETIWLVRSLGIDPATGREVFLTRYGQQTFQFDPLDITNVGERRPVLQGNINSNFVMFRRLTVMMVFHYAVQREIVNNTLFDRVENISMRQVMYNQDRRALHDRWHAPGDHAQFRTINLLGAQDQIVLSDRFVQTENFISLETISIGWQFDPTGWIRNYGMSDLRLSLNLSGTSGIHRMSNILQERGILFPEATTIMFSINARF
ncbi:MAG: SusC/RagA family TonB-linked outer membrane protein [Bacteroidales bacterium]|nr:SusC/RagA family TonB-linked outer membrane protein [Bacteroidales bacterium]